MIDMEMLEAIGGLIDQKLQPINSRLDKMDGRLDEMQEDISIIKVAVNYNGERLDNLVTLLEETNVIARKSV